MIPALALARGLPWKLIGFAALALMVAALVVALKMERQHSGKLKVQVEKVVEAREADRRAYAAAQREAAERNRAQVARIEQQQEKVSREIQSNLGTRLERLRGELRKQAAAARGSSRPGGLPAGGDTAGGADEAPGLCLAPADVLRAAENEERHDRLIDWVEQQGGIAR